MDDDPRILSKLPGKLVGADVDRINFRRATLKQDVGESSGRGTDIQRYEAGHVPAEMVEGVGQLDPAPRDPGMFLAPHLERRVVGERLPGFVDLALARKDQAGEDQGLGLGPTLNEAPVDEKLVGAKLGHRLRLQKLHAQRDTYADARTASMIVYHCS